MKTWLIRIRSAVVMGLAWAAGWAFVGMVIELFEPDPSLIDVWPSALAIPALLAGVVFSAVLGIAERRRRLDELSLARSGAWGAVSGLLVGLLPPAMVAVGAASSEEPLWWLAAVFVPPATLLGAVSALGSALWFRHGARGQPPAGAALEG